MKDWFLALYEKNPLMGSFVGLLLLLFAFAIVGVSIELISDLTEISTLSIVFLLSPFFLFIFKPVFMIVFLVGAFMWYSIGIYYALGIKGRPIRDRYIVKSETSDGR